MTEGKLVAVDREGRPVTGMVAAPVRFRTAPPETVGSISTRGRILVTYDTGAVEWHWKEATGLLRRLWHFVSGRAVPTRYVHGFRLYTAEGVLLWEYPANVTLTPGESLAVDLPQRRKS